jgi:hypothetical protein
MGCCASIFVSNEQQIDAVIAKFKVKKMKEIEPSSFPQLVTGRPIPIGKLLIFCYLLNELI